MDEPHAEAIPYGEWPSPFDASDVAGELIDFWHIEIDGDDVYWQETRPGPDGRTAIVRLDGEDHDPVTSPEFDVFSLIYENGGGSFLVTDDVLYFVNLPDQRVYRQPIDGAATPITPKSESPLGLRYGDFTASNEGDLVICVRENHDVVAAGEADEPEACLIRIPPDGDGAPKPIATGFDFYAAPRLSPDGKSLAYLAWNHPQMPWNGTELHLADVTPDGTLENDRVVLGGPDESVLQPDWHPDGTLHAVTDRTGWWNLHRYTGEAWLPYRVEPAEHAVPPWLLGLSSYAFLDQNRVAVLRIEDGEQSIVIVDTDGTVSEPSFPYETVGGEYGLPVLESDGETLYLVAGGPRAPDTFVEWQPGVEPVIRRDSGGPPVEEDILAVPEHRTFPTRDGEETHAFVYEPTNQYVDAPESDAPPLLIHAPGGPTLGTHAAFMPSFQFFTSRGFAVADVNYRGSTGYGRNYRDALSGKWGHTDVEDCLDVGIALAEEGTVDRDRLIIRGLSAGGYIALAAAAFHDVVVAATSINGIADLEEWARNTHKFESHYAEQLIGALPERQQRYHDRSPLHQPETVDANVLLFQGADDTIVPPEQAAAMADALEDHDLEYELHVFDGEGHLFQQPETIQRVHELELAFYRDVLGSESPD